MIMIQCDLSVGAASERLREYAARAYRSMTTSHRHRDARSGSFRLALALVHRCAQNRNIELHWPQSPNARLAAEEPALPVRSVQPQLGEPD
jgi:hypothetical protein